MSDTNPFEPKEVLVKQGAQGALPDLDKGVRMTVPDEEMAQIEARREGMLRGAFEGLEGGKIGGDMSDSDLWGAPHEMPDTGTAHVDEANAQVREMFKGMRDPDYQAPPAATDPIHQLQAPPAQPEPAAAPPASDPVAVENARRLLGKMQVPAEQVARMQPGEIVRQAELMQPYHAHVSSLIQQMRQGGAEQATGAEDIAGQGETMPSPPQAPAATSQLDEALTRLEDWDDDSKAVLGPVVETLRAQAQELAMLREAGVGSMVDQQIARLKASGYDFDRNPGAMDRVIAEAGALAETGRYRGNAAGAFDVAAMAAFGHAPRVTQAQNTFPRDAGQPTMRSHQSTFRDGWENLNPTQKAYRLFSAHEDGMELKELLG